MSLIQYVLVVMISIIVSIHAQKLAKQKIQSYASCRTDKDCKEKAFCFGNDDDTDGKCKCQKGYELIRNTTFYECLPAMKIGDPCGKDIQCQVTAGDLAFCDKYKICSCNDESHAYEGRCEYKAKIGEICMGDGNCYLENGTPGGGLGFCTDGRCKCGLNQKHSADRTKCLNSRKLGEPCVADEECTATTPNTKCSEKCICDPAYTEARNASTCVKAATQFDEPCDSDGQCSKYLKESICNGNKCGCETGFHGYTLKCVKTKKPGQPCEEDAECLYEKKLYENVKCQDKMCKCLYGNDGDGSCKIEKTDNSSASQLTYGVVYFEILFILVRLVLREYF
ncbi:hypothetical protein Zmor_011715 [Zophobas morio]|uniref:EB domain-containing protein n=2 Tax=Zophobas morio TaxID=2755281 RepID=A0AA38IN81_9CUCU|nr:hypothetical protein Zmor_011715 [Zophobas morio]